MDYADQQLVPHIYVRGLVEKVPADLLVGEL